MTLARIVIRGDWSDCVGTDYCEALGIYEVDDKGGPCNDAWDDAAQVAWDKWEPQNPVDVWEDEGPDYYIEVYDPEKHNMLRGGGGSFETDFIFIENRLDNPVNQ